MTTSEVQRAKVVLFADVLSGFGGIETYLDALARRLHFEKRPFCVAVSLNGHAPFLDDLEKLGVEVYRQPRVLGDRFHIRQRLLVQSVVRRLNPGDWVFCVRQPMPEVYLPLVIASHRRGAKVAASWIYTPEFLPLPPGRKGKLFQAAIAQTDVVISVSNAGVSQYSESYGYNGPVEVVRYHNRQFFVEPVPMPRAPPYAIGYVGRIDIYQKNLDTILSAFGILSENRDDVVLNIYGGGQDEARFAKMVDDAGLRERVCIHGRFQHDRDLPRIMRENHLFVYTSRFEGGPCFSLLEMLQAGRFVVTSPVGGIPDIYSGRPDIGDLVAPGDVLAIARALEGAIERIAAGSIDPEVIRATYVDNFSENIAHRRWLEALGLEELEPV